MHTHLLENVGGKVLQASDIDRSFFGRLQIATAYTQVTRRTNHAAGQTQRIVGKDGFRRTIIVPVGDARYETFDVQLRWAGFLARSVSAF